MAYATCAGGMTMPPGPETHTSASAFQQANAARAPGSGNINREAFRPRAMACIRSLDCSGLPRGLERKGQTQCGLLDIPA
ncbi:hypothetical protein QTI17_33720 [Variovorax sp. J31P179]|uniref:hypothetical protein n=1 Tax=Variovorax sp. J31P179 TaxID=3053508 RepID=UPI002577A17C|nr:hypothetical protein [Variovorax sp. J31P179]MDM0085559.1 hypothetical protein [Variovorax sp. J31P179]